MRRRARPLRLSAITVAVCVVAGACQSDGDDADATIGGSPIEEPSTVTEDPNDIDGTEESNGTESNGTGAADDGAPTTTTSDAATDDPTPTTLVLATSPEKRTEPTIVLGEPSTETVYEVGLIDPGLGPFVESATTHLADRLGIAPDAIEVLTAVLVTWPDSALGCRQPDLVYAPVLTDGSVIELRADGLVYRYHSGGERTPFPCDLPLDAPPPPIA